jgi:BNR repeat protein
MNSRIGVNVFASIFLSCIMSGCHSNRAESPPGGSLREITPPVSSGSFSPRVTSRSDGSVILCWLEPQGDTAATLRFSVWRDGSWSEPTTIAPAQPFSRHPSESPGVIALSDRNLIAYWSQKPPNGEKGTEKVDVYLALSTDGGSHWTNPTLVNQAGTGEENSYPSAAAVDDTHGALIWLDGSNWKKQRRVALMSRTVQSDGTMTKATVLDEDTCTCCPTSLVSAGNELNAAYRDHNSSNVRDISTVRFANGRCSGPQPVHEDNWHIAGCPVNGPVLAAKDRALAVAWFTGANEKAAVYEAFFDGTERKFSHPVRVDLGSPVGRAQIAVISDHTAFAFWVT